MLNMPTPIKNDAEESLHRLRIRRVGSHLLQLFHEVVSTSQLEISAPAT